MRKAAIKIHNDIAGYLVQNENGYQFNYDDAYLKKENASAISVTMPITQKVYTSKILFPFFDGLIPEGWLLDIAEKNWKLNTRDRIGLLLSCCKDCIGAVSVHEVKTDE